MGPGEVAPESGCTGGLEMAALVQPVKADLERTIAWIWTTPRLKLL
jgi:hypothetical protein